MEAIGTRVQAVESLEDVVKVRFLWVDRESIGRFRTWISLTLLKACMCPEVGGVGDALRGAAEPSYGSRHRP